MMRQGYQIQMAVTYTCEEEHSLFFLTSVCERHWEVQRTVRSLPRIDRLILSDALGFGHICRIRCWICSDLLGFARIRLA